MTYICIVCNTVQQIIYRKIVLTIFFSLFLSFSLSLSLSLSLSASLSLSFLSNNYVDPSSLYGDSLPPSAGNVIGGNIPPPLPIGWRRSSVGGRRRYRKRTRALGNTPPHPPSRSSCSIARWLFEVCSKSNLNFAVACLIL